MGKFVVKTTKSGFVFNLKAGNGEVIATSESYKSQDSCLNGVESVRKNCVGGVDSNSMFPSASCLHILFISEVLSEPLFITM